MAMGGFMFILKKISGAFKTLAFAIVLGYMVAWHNVYREDQKMVADMAITIEDQEEDQDEQDDRNFYIRIY